MFTQQVAASARTAPHVSRHLTGPSRWARKLPVANINFVKALFGGKAMAELATERWWSADTVAVVTGANKGIGAEIARLLAEQGLNVVLTARNESLGTETTKKLVASGVPGKVDFHQLDVSDPKSIDAFVEWLKKEKGGRLDVLVNNAGMAYKGNTFGADEAAITLATNFTGTAALCEAIKPLLKPGARIVNVSSRAGLTGIVRDPELQRRFISASSLGELQGLADRFVQGIRAGTYRAEGYPDSMYGVSKLCLSMYSRLLARELEPQGVAVNACCPGWCATDMSSWRGTKSAGEGADTPAWLALQPPKSQPTGGLWGERQQVAW